MPINKTKIKKDGKQQYRVRVNYTDADGKAHQMERVAYGSAEAKLLEQQMLNEIKKAPTSSKMTMKELYDKYMAAVKPDLRETTYDKKRRMFEGTILPPINDIRLDRFGVQSAEKWKSDIGSRDFGTTTAKNYFKELSEMLNYAVRLDYISTNPLSKIGNFKTPEFETSHEAVRYYTADEFKIYIEAARNYANEKGDLTSWGYYMFFMIAFFTGMRKGEINALKWSDIGDNIIHVRRSVAQKLKGEDRETPPKNKTSVRDLQIPVPLATALREHKLRQQADTRFTDDYRVCGGTACLRDTSIENHNKIYSNAAGLPHRTIHEFRHSHASLLANSGINIQEIARRLGHAKVEITWNTYSHLYPREEERALKILNEIKW